jgi:hypothetical protein
MTDPGIPLRILRDHDIDSEHELDMSNMRNNVYSLSHVDPGALSLHNNNKAQTNTLIALDDKLHLVNDAIDEIGWTSYHTKVYLLTFSA